MESDLLQSPNRMRPKRFLRLALLVIITGAAACDNVAFGGIQIELRPPDRAPSSPNADSISEGAEAEPEPLLPIELEPLLYLVERMDSGRASIVPIAQISGDGYSPLPDSAEFPDLIERFALARWEQGTEFSLLLHGSRVGTLISEGTTVADNSTCQERPRGRGYLEVRPETAELDRFLAVRAPESVGREPWFAVAPVGADANLRAASLNLAQRMIPALGVPWPTSIPAVRRDLQPFSLERGDGSALAVSYVFGDQLSVGQPNPRAYSLFMLAAEGETRYEPILTWYQRATAGKAFPRFVGAHDARGMGSPDAVLEVYGETDRWFAILGASGQDWSTLYSDPCGEPASRGAIRSFP